jgi:hypothetical protein
LTLELCLATPNSILSADHIPHRPSTTCRRTPLTHTNFDKRIKVSLQSQHVRTDK